MFLSLVVLELDVTLRPSGLVPVSLELASVVLVLLWAPVFAEVVRVVVVAVVALFVSWRVVLVGVLHCTVELAITSPCLHEVD